MKTAKRLLLGIVLGAFCGAALAGLLLRSPLIQQNIANIGLTFELDFGRFYAEHFYAVVASGGVIIGVIIGGSLAVSKRLGMVVLSLFMGMAIGGAAVHFTWAKVANWMSAVWEDHAESEYASAYWRALRAMDQAATNQTAITKFQANGRAALANYLHNAESRAQTWQGREPVDFLFTNSASYHIFQKYLATHTNTLPKDSDF
ncbi:MAG TPA: hypothetical protein VMA13_10730 [Candidatus Saccharimonadales bacterium]|nr:hypothetical protein [Candidatus Saccharimonadales bacterium]